MRIQLNYIGYKDGSLVPFRLLPKKVYPGKEQSPAGEKEFRDRLCVLQKVGNGGNGCFQKLNKVATRTHREQGIIKRNHYHFTIWAEFDDDDKHLVVGHIEHRLGDGQFQPPDLLREVMGSIMAPRSGGACPTGFCEEG